MLLKNAPKPEDALFDLAAADRVLVGHRVDRERRPAEPVSRLRGERDR